MRLIDADALHKELDDYIDDSILEISDVKDLIDNAPTVEVPENAVNCVLTMFGECSYNKTGCGNCEIKDKIRKALNERPKGEWIKMSDRYGVYFACEKCGYDRERAITNFCPNCGADMRGDTE